MEQAPCTAAVKFSILHEPISVWLIIYFFTGWPWRIYAGFFPKETDSSNWFDFPCSFNVEICDVLKETEKSKENSEEERARVADL